MSLRAQAEAKCAGDARHGATAKAARDAAEAVAAEAEKKADASEAELGAKKKPYDDDPLFAYLWRRRFGTAEYRSGGIACGRSIAWWREFVGFDDARPNYAALIEIPLRLREHATAKRAAVGSAAGGARPTIERRAMVEAGIEPKEKALAEARHKLAALDDTVEKKHALLHKVDEARAGPGRGRQQPGLQRGPDDHRRGRQQRRPRHPLHGGAPHADECRRSHRAPASRRSTRRSARPMPRSPACARRMVDLVAAAAGRSSSVRDRFRRTGYDHPQTTFENEGAISDTLKNVLEGVVRSGVLWDLLRQGYRSRPTQGRPDFGSPSFPFPFPLPGGSTGSSRGG